MNRNQMAHEYLLKLLETGHTGLENVQYAFNLADAMLEEANKRKETGFPLDLNEVK